MTDHAGNTIFSISNTDDPKFLRVELMAATEISFEVEVPKGQYTELFNRICNIAPVMARLDSDLMEAFDDAGRTQPQPYDISLVRNFAKTYNFRNVNCALPGFEEMPNA